MGIILSLKPLSLHWGMGRGRGEWEGGRGWRSDNISPFSLSICPSYYFWINEIGLAPWNNFVKPLRNPYGAQVSTFVLNQMRFG